MFRVACFSSQESDRKRGQITVLLSFHLDLFVESYFLTLSEYQSLAFVIIQKFYTEMESQNVAVCILTLSNKENKHQLLSIFFPCRTHFSIFIFDKMTNLFTYLSCSCTRCRRR